MKHIQQIHEITNSLCLAFYNFIFVLLVGYRHEVSELSIKIVVRGASDSVQS